MRIVRQYLETIDGLNIFSIIGLLIFIVFFTLVVIHTLRIDKSDIEEFSHMPLDEDQDLTT